MSKPVSDEMLRSLAGTSEIAAELIAARKEIRDLELIASHVFTPVPSDPRAELCQKCGVDLRSSVHLTPTRQAASNRLSRILDFNEERFRREAAGELTTDEEWDAFVDEWGGRVDE